MSKKNNNSNGYCMFCGRRESEVSMLLQGLEACICADCIKLAGEYLEDYGRQNAPQAKSGRVENEYKPMDIHAYLRCDLCRFFCSAPTRLDEIFRIMRRHIIGRGCGRMISSPTTNIDETR